MSPAEYYSGGVMSSAEDYLYAEEIAERANSEQDRELAAVMFQNAQVHALLAIVERLDRIAAVLEHADGES